MTQTVTMPKLGFDMAEGTLVRWVIAEGQPVAKGAVLAEIETDKATVEVESSFEGLVYKQLAKEGDVVPVGIPIAIIAAPGEKVEETQVSQPAPEAESPKTGEKASQPVSPAPAPAGQMAGEKADLPGTSPVPGIPGGLRASPIARKMAEEKGLDLHQLRGSGPEGRIIKKDIEAYLAQPQPAAQPAQTAAIPQTLQPGQPVPALSPLPMPGVTPELPDETISLSRLRLAIGRRMLEAKQQAPHFYVTHEFDMQPLIDLRKQVNQLLPEAEKISVNDFLVKAIALALRQFPNLNASFMGDKVIRHGHINVGVAVSVEGGLLTVSIRDTDLKPLRQIGAELHAMIERARQGKVRPDDIEGSTFSISNMGMFEVESFIAIINPPEAAILAVGSTREVPVVKEGAIAPGLRMKATISIDHRVSDGAEGARFLQTLDLFLQHPLRLLL